MTMESGSLARDQESAASLGISGELLEMLVCPLDHGKLAVATGSLTCTVCGRTYTVDDGIPNMVIEAEPKGER